MSLGNTILTHRRDRASPRADLHEYPKTNIVTATFELPGIKQQDVNIEVHGNRLTVSGESKRSRNYDKGSYAVREHSYGKFSRTLQIPEGIKSGDLHAKMENGALVASGNQPGIDMHRPPLPRLHSALPVHTHPLLPRTVPAIATPCVRCYASFF
ncbi:HSP20-like chaperone [Suillus lakei]|nr:HSP20-like chaperone [Suillus lakei]